MRFVLVPEGGYRPSLVVDVVPDAGDEAVRHAFREALLGYGCSNGILFDAKACVLFHDSYTDMSPASIKVDAELGTDVVVARSGSGSLDARVERWLTLLTERWRDALPEGDDAAPFITDVVPAASGSFVRSLGAER